VGTYAAIPVRALADPAMTEAPLRALLAIGSFVPARPDPRTGERSTWASVGTLAARARMDERRFRRALSLIIERGYVRRVDRPGRTSYLVVLFEDPSPLAESARGTPGGIDQGPEAPGVAEEALAESTRGGGIDQPPPGGIGQGTPGGIRQPKEVVLDVGRDSSSPQQQQHARANGGGGGDEPEPVPTLPFAAEHHAEAFARFFRASHSPRALAHEVRLLAEGGETPSRGRVAAAGWPIVGEALHEMGVANARPSPRTLRGFVDTLTASGGRVDPQDTGGRGAAGDVNPWAVAAANARRD
jgi:hypothetical protein